MGSYGFRTVPYLDVVNRKIDREPAVPKKQKILAVPNVVVTNH